MLRRRRALLVVLALLAAAVLAAGGGGTWSAFSATTGISSTLSSAADWTAPTVPASVIAHSSAGAGIKTGATYAVYANASDSGNPASGVSTVTANVNSITSGQTGVALSACSTACTVGGVTYGYKSAQLTAGTLSGSSVSYTVTAKDVANNTTSALPFSVTVDTTAPTVGAGAAAHAFAVARVKQNGTYWVYANATDAGSGIDTVTANVNNITTGQTAVPLTACSSSCTVAGVSYSYKSAQLTSNTTLSAGTKTFTITATDAAGNSNTPTSFNATVDNTGPTPSNVQTTDHGGTAGRAQATDVITLTTSEQLDPNEILAGWTGSSQSIVVRITNAAAGAHDFVTFWNSTNTTQLPLGSIDLGAAGYVNTRTVATFGATGTASTMVQSTTTLTITLGTLTGTVNTVGTNLRMVWTPSTALTDLAGNAISGSANESGTLDRNF